MITQEDYLPCTLGYNPNDRCFHIEEDISGFKGYRGEIIADKIPERLAINFIEFIDKKYVYGRMVKSTFDYLNNRPPIEIIKKELELFFLLDSKGYRRKLVGYR